MDENLEKLRMLHSDTTEWCPPFATAELCGAPFKRHMPTYTYAIRSDLRSSIIHVFLDRL